MAEKDTEKNTQSSKLGQKAKQAKVQTLRPWVIKSQKKGSDHVFENFRKGRSPWANELSLELRWEVWLYRQREWKTFSMEATEP